MSALGNLVAGVAHEINNPVGCIVGNVGAAQDYINDLLNLIELYQEELPQPSAKIAEELEDLDLDYVREDLPKLIKAMKDGGDRIKSISNSLRTFSRVDSDIEQKFNIHEGIDSTLLILRHRLKANSHRPAIEVVTDYGILPKIACFPGQLNQVFMNIFANAIDALDESNLGRSFAEIQDNPNRITIRTTVENDSVKIAIADNGLGIPDSVKFRIFDHLFTTKAVGKGTGLGLAIARQIILEKHGGAIEVNSEIAKGTEFILTLPALMLT
jgi:signal transduction histidine kinase